MAKSEKLVVSVPEKKDAFSRILRFMGKSDITLSAQEEVILDRWVYCDVLLRGRIMTHDEVVQKMVDTWSISRFTALNDINQTQRLFERARQVSKKYLLHHHIEQIGLTIQKAAGNSEQMELMPKLFDSYTKAIAALPDDHVADKQPPPMFVFNLPAGQQMDAPLSAEEAMKAADELLMKENSDGVFEVEQ